MLRAAQRPRFSRSLAGGSLARAVGLGAQNLIAKIGTARLSDWKLLFGRGPSSYQEGFEALFVIKSDGNGRVLLLLLVERVDVGRRAMVEEHPHSPLDLFHRANQLHFHEQ